MVLSAAFYCAERKMKFGKANYWVRQAVISAFFGGISPDSQSFGLMNAITSYLPAFLAISRSFESLMSIFYSHKNERYFLPLKYEKALEIQGLLGR